MGGTYRIVDHTEPMTREEIKQLYDGYWVYIVNSEFTDTNGFIRGIPAVIGAFPYDGAEEGIYTKFKEEKYEDRCSLVFTHNQFIASLPSVKGEAV